MIDAHKALARAIDDLYGKFARRQIEPNDIVRSLPAATSDRSWMTHAHICKTNHQPDAAVFAHFTRDMGAILDCGAHWGYTALAIRLFGSDCPIVSFEASAGNADCLDEFRRLDGNYDFAITALGSIDAERKLYCPIVNGYPITGLNCIDGTIFDEHHRNHIVSLIGSTLPIAENYHCQLLETSTSVRRLDEVLAHKDFSVPTKPIAAIKLDVDGSENAVLIGANDTLQRYLPFIMIEGANRDSGVVSILRGLGYLYADREDGQVRLNEKMSLAVNGYWLHPQHMDRYAAIGLIRRAAVVAA